MLFALMNPEERGWLSKVKAQQPLLLNSHLGWKPGVHGFLSEKKKKTKLFLKGFRLIQETEATQNLQEHCNYHFYPCDRF